MNDREKILAFLSEHGDSTPKQIADPKLPSSERLVSAYAHFTLDLHLHLLW